MHGIGSIQDQQGKTEVALQQFWRNKFWALLHKAINCRLNKGA